MPVRALSDSCGPRELLAIKPDAEADRPRRILHSTSADERQRQKRRKLGHHFQLCPVVSGLSCGNLTENAREYDGDLACPGYTTTTLHYFQDPSQQEKRSQPNGHAQTGA